MNDSVSNSNQFILTREPSLLLILVVVLTGISAFINVYSIQAILPILMHDFQASAVEVGSAVGATILAVSLISACIGMLSDALGRRWVIIISIILLSVPTGLIFFAQSMHEIYLYRFFQGLVVPGIAVVIMAYIGEEFRGRNMTKLMSAYIAGTVFGGFLGRFIVGYLDEFFGWRTAFLMMAFINLFISILVFYYLPKSLYFVADKKIGHAFKTLTLHLTNKNLLAACATGACVLFSLVGGFTYINIYLSQAPFYLSSAQLANIFAVYLLGVIITPLSSKVIIRFGVRKTIALALLSSSMGILLTNIHNLVTIIIGLAMMSSGIFITQSATVTFIANRITEGRSLATGLYNTCYYFGGFIGAWMCGYAYIYYQWWGTTLTLIAVQLLAIIIAWCNMKPLVNQLKGY